MIYENKDLKKLIILNFLFNSFCLEGFTKL